MKHLRQAFMALLILTLASTAAAQTKPVAVISGQDLLKAVSQARGKVVVVNFWASWCGPCRQEIPELMAIRKQIPEDKLLLIGVSVDQDPAAYASYVARTEFNYPVYRAAPDVSTIFSIRAIPRTVVYSPKGEMAHSQEGYMPGHDLLRLINKLSGS
jgi:thiol-disulfide isomerase/thioredoxin